MNKEIEIPEGYEAKIEGNKVIIVPKESEDEKIIKAIIGALNDTQIAGYGDISIGSMLSWLEKQKEQKPVQWSEEDENRFNNLIFLVEYSGEGQATKEGFIKFIKRLKSLRPQSAQDKFDEAMHVADKFEERYEAGVYDTKAKSWKPSEEQMKALKHFIGPSIEGAIVAELYDDLQKLIDLNRTANPQGL